MSGDGDLGVPNEGVGDGVDVGSARGVAEGRGDDVEEAAACAGMAEVAGEQGNAHLAPGRGELHRVHYTCDDVMDGHQGIPTGDAIPPDENWT